MFGIESALFIAKFVAQLAINYNDMAHKQGVSPESELNEEIYTEALTETLQAFCAEDARGHGRLLGMRHRLAELMPSRKLNLDHLTVMYANDIAILRNLNINDDQVIAQIIGNPP